MKRLGITTALSVLMMSAVPCTPSADVLKELRLDATSGIGLTIAADSAVKVEGEASLRIATKWPTTVCLGSFAGRQIENRKLIYRARVRSDLNGKAFLEMWVRVGGGQYFSRGLHSTIDGKADWKIIQTQFLLKEGQKAEEITLNLVINGKGTVWVDDVVLSEEPLG